MGIHTSAITYRRVIPIPMNLYLQNYNFHNQKYKLLPVYRWF